MILSESEKNRIKGLYGLVTEADTAPPPDESVLIAKKNPFKYDEYKEARQLYSNKLKDGDLFFKINDIDEFVNYSFTHNKKIANEFVKELVGKTIRLNYKNGEDKIFEIIDIECTNGDFDGLSLYFNLKMKNEQGDIISDGLSFRYSFGFIAQFENQKTTSDKIANFLESLVDKMIKTTGIRRHTNAFLPNSNLDLVPDEYFEIREIKREKTDF